MGSQWGAYTYIRKYGSTNIPRASRSNESTLSRRLAAAHVNCSILSPINSTAWRVSRSNEEKTTVQAVIFGHLPSLQSNFQPQNAFLSPFFLFLPRIDLLERNLSKIFPFFSFFFSLLLGEKFLSRKFPKHRRDLVPVQNSTKLKLRDTRSWGSRHRRW